MSPDPALQSLHHAIVESSQDAIVVKDLDGTIRSWNASAERMFGYSAAEVIGQSIMILAVEPGEISRILADLREGRRTESYDTRRRRRDGSMLDVSVSVSPIHDEAGTVVGGAAISRDITARIRGLAALRLSELRYRTLVSQLPDAAVYQYDRDFRIVHAEGALLAQSGRTSAEMQDRSLWDLMPADRAEDFHAHYCRALEGHAQEVEWESANGRVLALDLVPLREGANDVVGVIALARDITERKRIERDLHFQAELLDHIEVAVLATDVEGRVTHWNRQAEVYYERPRELALGRPLAALNQAYGRPDPSEVMERLASGETTREEMLIPRSDGSVLPLFTTSSGVLDADGALIGFVAASVDLTSARAAADELHSARTLFESAFDNAPMGMVLIDAVEEHRGAVMRVNRAMAEMLGTDPGTPSGLLGDHVHPDDLAAISPALDRLLAGLEDAFKAELRFRDAGGGTVWTEVSVSLVCDVGGRPRHAVALIHDVSGARAAQAEKANLERRLRQAQKLDGIGRMAGGIAHDFNNLLAVIVNYADLVAEELPPGERLRGDVEEIKEAAERATALTRQLLVFGRRDVVQPRPLDLNAIVADTKRLLRRTIGEDVDLRTELAPDLRPVRADRSQMEQVLLNLTLNARDAMPEGGALTIATANVELDEAYATLHTGVRVGSYVRVTVSDEGVGMTPEVLQQAFEPFFTTKPQSAGTGLGLATVYGIVTTAGGHVDLYSEPGHGTAVKVLLPVSDEAPAAPVAGEESAPALGRGETVLVVEDEPSVRALAALLLEGAGYQVVQAGRAEDAIALAASHELDLMLTDVVMPGMSGSDLAAALWERTPELRVLYMSGYTDDVVMRHGVLERRLAFLEKPFTRAGLLRAVRDRLDDAVESAHA